MKVVLARGAMRPRLLAELDRDDDRALLALLVDIDVTDAEVMELLAEDLTDAERTEVAEALGLDIDQGSQDPRT